MLAGTASWLARGIHQQVNFHGAGMAYTITSASSMRAILKSNCYHRERHNAPCSYGESSDMLLFGAVEIVFSLIPDFHEMAWLSILAAVMSFCYSSIGFGLGFGKVIGMLYLVLLSTNSFKELVTGDDGPLVRTGTVWTCVAHIITAIIGAGILSLAWSIAQLGWIAGPVSMLCFAVVTYVSAFLLSDCYRTPHPVTGSRNCSYMDAVRVLLGEKQTWICALLQYLNFYGTSIAYTITTSISMRAIQKSDCYHREGHGAPCSYGDSFYMLLFGAIQIVLSQIPNFHEMAWLSILAAIMSFSYASIGFALGIAKVIANGGIKGGIGGVPVASTAQKVWRVSQALGDIAFAYPYSIILLEIEDTLKSPPPENQTMKKASRISVLITTFFYLCCGCFGYASFGNDTPGNLLTGFGFYEPYWLVDFANACVVLHLVGGYQVFSQPVFSFVDRWSAEKFPQSGFVNKFYTIQLPCLPPYRLKLFRLCYRTIYAASTTAIAIFFPYFNQVIGLLGAFNFWPLAVYFPVKMYFVQRKIGAWTKKWVALQVFSAVSLLVSLFALIGSIEGVVSEKLS